MSHHTRTLASLGALTVVALFGAACGGDLAITGSADDHAESGSDDHDESFSFGEPGDPADADRVIEIEMLDELAFDPDSIEVSVGETVTLRVTNTGNLEHDFTLGDEQTQDDHEQEMAEMAGSGEPEGSQGHGDPNVIGLAPGESGEITWTFSEPGEFLYGCHVPGHYAGGMVGTVTVS